MAVEQYLIAVEMEERCQKRSGLDLQDCVFLPRPKKRLRRHVEIH
jgi:hypothetical protein